MNSLQAARDSKISEVEMTELILPQHSNNMNTVFGGVLTSWVDMAASISALRHANKPVVTASIDAMHFFQPIKLGWIVRIKAKVNQTWNSSCEVGVKIFAENTLTNETYHTASAYVTMVALDSHNRPTPIPQVSHVAPEDKKRQEAADMRRASRLKLKQELAQRHHNK
ncbi:MAG: acyl-CoA thioesterase [Oligoflexales bacterium]|nr:acyl-CoA thioesterase [Oligoflexales bacterium]